MKMANSFRQIVAWTLIAGALLYLVVYIALALRAHEFSAEAKLANVLNPVVVVLGNRTVTKGVPNVCMTGRVDKAMELIAQHHGRAMLLSGGSDPVEQNFESQVMANYAIGKGFKGQLIQENKSTTTYENLKYSALILRNEGAKTVIVVSEPYQLWRISLLASAQGMNNQFDLQYAAAKTECWNMQGMLSTGAVREPFALVKNFVQGNFFKLP